MPWFDPLLQRLRQRIRPAPPRAWMVADTASRMVAQTRLLRAAPQVVWIDVPQATDAALLSTPLRAHHPKARLLSAHAGWKRPRPQRDTLAPDQCDWVLALFPELPAARPSTAINPANDPAQAALALALAHWRRLLRADGVLFIATLGPATALELAGLPGFEAGGSETLAPACSDLHTLGDALVTAGFADPVIDAEVVQLTFTEPQRCLEELQRMGWRFASAATEQAFTQALAQQRTAPYVCSVEINLAHAFRAATRSGGVDVEDLRRSLRRPRQA